MADWEPHFDYKDESRWPPKDHPLYSAFHDARLGFGNGEWNYRKALEYGQLVALQVVKEFVADAVDLTARSLEKHQRRMISYVHR